MSPYSCCASPTCILVTVSFLSSGQSVFHRNVGSENHMINFASDSLFRLDDVGSEEYNKILLTHIHLGFKLCTLMPEDGRGWPKCVASSVGFNKFVVFGGNK